REHAVTAFAAARISYRHGADAEEVLQLAEQEPELRAMACPCEGVAFAELAFSLRKEFAESLTDVRRRCRLAMGICQGARCAGADTLLVSRAPGATAMSSGAFDFASSEDDAPLAEAARRLGRRAGHPYALLGEDLIPSIDAAIDLLRRSLPGLRLEGARTAADRNLWLATPLGLSKPAALAQGPIAAGDLRSLST